MTSIPVPPAPSASLLLVRDGASGLEVLVLSRSRRLDFAGGMLVFPGGRVDREDHLPALRRASRTGIDTPPGDIAWRLAALRELFEETGLLLARGAGRASLLGERARAALARRWRRRLHRGSLRLSHLVARSGLVFDLAALVPFAHWVTPAMAPKRFDTRFYLARAPHRQRASSDGIENFDIAWRRPADILAAWQEGREKLMFPTRLNLMKLARADDVATALAMTRATPIITVTPRIATDGARRLVIPEEAGFGVTEALHRDLDPFEARMLSEHLEALERHPWSD